MKFFDPTSSKQTVKTIYKTLIHSSPKNYPKEDGASRQDAVPAVHQPAQGLGSSSQLGLASSEENWLQRTSGTDIHPGKLGGFRTRHWRDAYARSNCFVAEEEELVWRYASGGAEVKLLLDGNVSGCFCD